MLREQFKLEVGVFGTLGAGAPIAPKPVLLRPAPGLGAVAVPACDPARGPPRDYLRTRLEARLAFPGADEDEDAEEIAGATRRFSVLETTSGLPDDSREEDERRAERRLREMRARVKESRLGPL